MTELIKPVRVYSYCDYLINPYDRTGLTDMYLLPY